MVNYTETNPNTFDLSKPASSYKNLSGINFTSSIKLPTTHFTFLEPFESYHVSNSQTGKLNSTSLSKCVRQQPYTLSKPEPSVDGNQNAILARLSSISSTFKSIFVRPKNSKLVNTITNKKMSSSQAQVQAEERFKLNLFSVNNDEDLNREQTSSYEMSNKIEKIISSSVQLESFKSQLIKANRMNENVEEKCLASSSSSSSSSSASSSSSTISTLSTTSNLTNNSTIAPLLVKNGEKGVKKASEAHQRAAMMTNTIQTGNLGKLFFFNIF